MSDYAKRDWDVRMKRAPTVLDLPQHALTARERMPSIQACAAGRAGRGQPSARGRLRRRPPSAPGNGPGAPADLAAVRVEACAGGPSGALPAGDHGRTRGVEPLAAGVDCGLALGAEPLPVLTEV